MNPFLALEQYLYLGAPLKVTTKSLSGHSPSLTFYPLSNFVHYEPQPAPQTVSAEATKTELKLPLEVLPAFGLFLAIM